MSTENLHPQWKTILDEIEENVHVASRQATAYLDLQKACDQSSFCQEVRKERSHLNRIALVRYSEM